MPTFVYMTRCDGCGHCVDICPSDIMHIDTVTRRAYNIEPNMCWECYSCVKACPHQAIDVRGYADFAPLGHSVRVKRDEEKGVIAWRIKFRNGKKDMDLLAPITTKPWGSGTPDLREETPPSDAERDSQRLFNEPKYIRFDEGDVHTLNMSGCYSVYMNYLRLHEMTVSLTVFCNHRQCERKSKHGFLWAGEFVAGGADGRE